jgi:Icc-related predicted phosphoesterase
MNIQIFSDLHVDVSRPPPITIGTDVDVVVVAGDTAEGAGNAFVALRHIVPERIPIVMVMGNHEYYHHCIPDELALARELAPTLNVHLLENASVVLKAEGSGTPVLFAGCSLWTDYQVFGANNAASAMRAALKGLNDHRLITWQKRPWKRFRPQEAALMHTASKAFLIKTLATPFPGPTVVVCHHGHWPSAHPQHQTDILTAAFVSNLTFIEEYQPDFFIHGHVHSSSDYRVGRTRVLCNPRGYPGENPNFSLSLVVEVGS